MYKYVKICIDTTLMEVKMNDLLTKSQLAEALQVTPYAIDKYLSKGFKARIKNPLRFTLEDFIRWENEQRKEDDHEKTN